MQSVQMGSILQKRSVSITDKQWIKLLEELEKMELYLVIKSSNQCVGLSPAGGFIPMPSKDDEFSVCTKEQLLERGLAVGHHIVK
jgi:hypothetical protein